MTSTKKNSGSKILFPEDVIGLEIAQRVSEHAQEIDQRIADDVRKDSIIEKIESIQPGAILDLYTPFQFALGLKIPNTK